MFDRPRADLYTRSVLTAIAILLGILVLRPATHPAPVEAQSTTPSLYIEPGATLIRRPDGSSLGEGKMVVDLKTGDIWGFPTSTVGSLYPVGIPNGKTPVTKAVYLGRFDFASMTRVP